MKSPTLPVEEILPDLRQALRGSPAAVVSAPPGAGKTTRVPLALLDEEWLSAKKILMLEPRRLAARRAAEFMARQLGEEPGGVVGYRIRGETRTGQRTRVEVLTEGILTRMIQTDPALPGVGCVIFDEFHERTIHADLGLALVLEVMAHLRQELRLVLMSATLDGVGVAGFLGGVPVVESRGRAYPVEIRYLNYSVQGAIERSVAEVIARAMLQEPGDILVFLPGWREIRRVATLLQEAALPEDIDLHQLHGDAPYAEQRRALAPGMPGKRKVILSTALAETSLTIDGVRVVVDSGLARVSRFDPRRGMSALVTETVSRSTADQRAGRAGRQAPGVCYRVWTKKEQGGLAAYPAPEILLTDLAPLALELARWGDPEARTLRFLDRPPAAHLMRARKVLRDLGALDEAGRLSSHGAEMAGLPVHPRLAHMMLRSRELGLGGCAADVAALLEERDPARGPDRIDLRVRLDTFRARGADRAARARALGEAHRLRVLLNVPPGRAEDISRAGLILALAYPERVAGVREADSLYYQTASGTGAVLPPGSALSRQKLLALGELDGAGTEARILLAAPLSHEDLMECCGGHLVEEERTEWDESEQAVRAVRLRRLGMLELEARAVEPEPEARNRAMLEGIRRMGLESLPWDRASSSLRSRSEWLRARGLVGETWPDLSDERLLGDLEGWLAPFLGDSRRREHLARINLLAALRGLFGGPQLRELESLAPAELAVPTGSKIRLDYTGTGPPVLAVRLQEMFGERETPRIARGSVAVLIHLLSPAGRPLAVTQDLRSFWQNAYQEVRKEMRGRYPKHHWPDDPLEAVPTRRTKRARKI